MSLIARSIDYLKIIFEFSIFVQSEKNTLIDILLARSVTGESPTKRGRFRKIGGLSPVRETSKSYALQGGRDAEPAQSTNVKAKADAKGSRKSAKKLILRATREDHDGASDDERPAGEYHEAFELCNI